jgi:hypothetical protein
VALAGPLTSLALGAGAALTASVAGVSLLPINILSGSLLARLAWANLLLGVFNLLPAFPLDGGRVLRAILERRNGVESATHMAARIGRGMAAALFAAGIVWDLWLILIAVFVFVGATQEEVATTVHTLLADHRVSQLMRSPVRCLESGRRLGSLTQYWTGPEVVTSDGHYRGLAVGQELMTGDADALIRDFTDHEAPTLSPDEDLGRSALDKLVESGYPLLAVVEHGTPVGVLLTEDVARWIGQHPECPRSTTDQRPY